MAYKRAKVYTDGSHYIAIPHTERRTKYRPKSKEEEITVITNEVADVSEQDTPAAPASEMQMPAPSKQNTEPQVIERKMTRKELFNEVYNESKDMPHSERKEKLVESIAPYMENEDEARLFVDANIERTKRNLQARKVRIMRKVYLNEFNYFCTFTYDDNLHTEDSFKRKLKKCLYHLTERKGWRYIGVWERSPVKKRLHFHGLIYVPDGAMKGNIEEVRDYSLITHKMQITHQNDYFKSRFGRNDFEPIDEPTRIGDAIAYIMKYLEKSGEKIFSSKGLPQFVISDILEDDVVCRYGQEDKKLLLFDDFTLIDDGCVIGQASKDNLKKMPTE